MARPRAYPQEAAYLAVRGVNPAVLALPCSDPSTRAFDQDTTFADVIGSPRLPVEKAYELLVAAGIHVPVVQPQLALATPTAVKQARPAPP